MCPAMATILQTSPEQSPNPWLPGLPTLAGTFLDVTTGRAIAGQAQIQPNCH